MAADRSSDGRRTFACAPGETVDLLLISVIALVALAFLFDFTNGFHDAANSVATVVATRAMPAKWAPPFSAFFNFIALIVVGTGVANTVAKTVNPGYESIAIVFSALLAAIAWNYITWWAGMPSSSSHAIIGGLVGAGLSAGGTDAIGWASVQKVAIWIIASPFIAFAISFLVMYVVAGVQRLTRAHDDAKPFKVLQVFTAAGVSFAHGANDAQKTMGVIAALLVSAGYLEANPTDGSIHPPSWVEIGAYGAIALGTMWGGWKIIETMGLKLTRLNANSGLAANIGTMTAVLAGTFLKAPLSTTQAAASSVVGSGVASGRGANWKIVSEMVLAWVVTIPSAMILSWSLYKLTQLPTAAAWLAVGAVLVGFFLWVAYAMTHTIHAKDVEAELLPEAELDEDLPVHPHLEGLGPVA
jgi:inorganic phosphate transporter, PiT family